MLAGVTEVAERLGVSRQRFSAVRERADFPVPVAELSSGPVWDLADVDRWIGSGARRGPGRPRSSERVLGERFVLEGTPVGSGGFADVFRATDRRTGEVVAVKVLKDIQDVDQEEVKRFRRELRVMETLDHPHVVALLAHGTLEGTEDLWCAMPLAVGSLRDEIAGMRGQQPAVVDLARQLCAGVGHAHEKRVLHRDIKPGNVLRTPDGTWQVSDFGLAREEDRKSQALTTTLAQGMGTYFYTSPEQWQHPKGADVRDDIFSIGKVLQQALTGDLPIDQAANLPESPLRNVLVRATGPREQRYGSCADLMAAIEQAVAAYSPQMEGPEDRQRRLQPRLAGEKVDQEAAEELLLWITADNLDRQVLHAGPAFIAVTPPTLVWMWQNRPGLFRRAYAVVAEWVRGYGHEWSYCDTVAHKIQQVVAVCEGDPEVLRLSVSALTALGASHNRWHVRDSLVELLQGIRTPGAALAALEGLQDVPADQVEWSISRFAARTLHPVLREGVRTIITPQ